MAAVFDNWFDQLMRDTCPDHGKGEGVAFVIPSPERPCCKEERERLARLEAVGVDIEAHEEDIKRDANGCNCDVDYQCLNVLCREYNENYVRQWRRS